MKARPRSPRAAGGGPHLGLTHADIATQLAERCRTPSRRSGKASGLDVTFRLTAPGVRSGRRRRGGARVSPPRARASAARSGTTILSFAPEPHVRRNGVRTLTV
jgi:hypothetical protein